MSRAVADWFQASALRGIPNAGWARAVSESFVSRRPGAGIAIRIGNDLRLAKMHSPAVAVSVPRIRHWPSGLTRPSDPIGDTASIHAGAHEREILNIPKLPEVMWSGFSSPIGLGSASSAVLAMGAEYHLLDPEVRRHGGLLIRNVAPNVRTLKMRFVVNLVLRTDCDVNPPDSECREPLGPRHTKAREPDPRCAE